MWNCGLVLIPVRGFGSECVTHAISRASLSKLERWVDKTSEKMRIKTCQSARHFPRVNSRSFMTQRTAPDSKRCLREINDLHSELMSSLLAQSLAPVPNSDSRASSCQRFIKSGLFSQNEAILSPQSPRSCEKSIEQIAVEKASISVTISSFKAIFFQLDDQPLFGFCRAGAN